MSEYDQMCKAGTAENTLSWFHLISWFGNFVKRQLSHRNYGILRSVKYYFPNKRSMFNDPKVFMPVNFVTTLKFALILISQWLLINLQERGSVAELCFKKNCFRGYLHSVKESWPYANQCFFFEIRFIGGNMHPNWFWQMICTIQ